MQVPGIKETLEQTHKYGIETVFSVILVIFVLCVFLYILKWVFGKADLLAKQTHERELALALIINNGMKSISDGLNQNSQICQEIMRNIKDGFDAVKRADEYHRQDLVQISKKLDDQECRATGGV